MREGWIVGIDSTPGRIGMFSDEQAALDFAHFDSQLEETAYVVMRMNRDGTFTAIADYPQAC